MLSKGRNPVKMTEYLIHKYLRDFQGQFLMKQAPLFNVLHCTLFESIFAKPHILYF